LTCELRFGDGRRAPGIVADISRTGVFIQTSANAAPDSLVELILMPSGGEKILVRARVARLKKVDQRLVSISAAGLGLEILDAPEAYYREIPSDGDEPAPEAHRCANASAPQARPAAAARKWKVRVSQVSGPRSRVVEVEAESEDAARTAALVRVGAGWQAIDVASA
jgi:hypothetical protein